MRPERLFLAVPLADGVRRGLAEFLAHSGATLPGRAVPPANWHFTLRFLGDTEPVQRDRLRAALGAGSLGAAFGVRLTRLGAFPSPRRASVVWIGAEPAEALRRLAERVEAHARACGFEAEDRPFRAHLTLSRVRRPEDVTTLLQRTPDFDHPATIDRVVLYRSELGGGPPRYVRLDEWPLTSPR